MILISPQKLVDAAKLATTQRKLVKQAAKYKGGEFKFNSEIYKSMPNEYKKLADELTQSSGAYSKNPVKKIKSWINRFNAIVGLEKEIINGTKEFK